MAFVGESTVTGNDLVNQLEIGTLLEVTAAGELTVIEVPEPPAPNFMVGSLVDHPKYGSGQVSRMSVHLSYPVEFGADQVLVAFDDGVVRAVDLEKLTEAAW